jgi:hypothetical protein
MFGMTYPSGGVCYLGEVDIRRDMCARDDEAGNIRILFASWNASATEMLANRSP